MTTYSVGWFCLLVISIHTPTRGVTSSVAVSEIFLPNFNPHSHKGSDFHLHPMIDITIISIHTPTRGVTRISNLTDYVSGISIHTPTRGVTNFFSLLSNVSRDFNPHSHKGSDIYTQTIRLELLDFNPHSHKGSDNIPLLGVSYYQLFQSTLPQGE